MSNLPYPIFPTFNQNSGWIPESRQITCNTTYKFVLPPFSPNPSYYCYEQKESEDETDVVASNTQEKNCDDEDEKQLDSNGENTNNQEDHDENEQDEQQFSGGQESLDYTDTNTDGNLFPGLRGYENELPEYENGSTFDPNWNTLTDECYENYWPGEMYYENYHYE